MRAACCARRCGILLLDGILWVSSVLRVLFVCIENANRSQMAAAFARKHGSGRVEVHSAGSRPSAAVNPRAIAFMKECGCDISAQVPQPLSRYADDEFDAVVTVGCGDACPWVPAHRREDWALPDPKARPDDEFRAVRDQIEQRVLTLLDRLGAGAEV